MLEIHLMRDEDAVALARRVARRQRDLAAKQPLLSANVDVEALAASLRSVRDGVFVATRGTQVVGHLRATVLHAADFGTAAWVNPDGLSYDDTLALEALFSAAADRELKEHVSRWFVWTDTDAAPDWLELGFSLMHRRGLLALESLKSPSVAPQGLSIRRGTIDDLDVALELDGELSRFQSRGPSYALDLDDSSQRDDWLETLEDPDATLWLAERSGEVIAQCVTFPHPELIAIAPGTVHLSAVTVRESHRGSGVGTALVDHALAAACAGGFHIAATNWRVTNTSAGRFWTNYGFTATHVRLRRELRELA